MEISSPSQAVMEEGEMLTSNGPVIVITWTPWSVLPQLSVAIQVLVIIVSQPFCWVSSLKAISTSESQLSEALILVGGEGAIPPLLLSIITLVGILVSTGGEVSSTMMVWEVVAVFPQASVAVQVLIIE